MTWIAACSGQRGTYQEVMITDEERQKLCRDLREHRRTLFLNEKAADEIERLAAELKQVEAENEHHMRLAFVDAGANPARTWKEEAERLKLLLLSDRHPDVPLNQLKSGNAND